MSKNIFNHSNPFTLGVEEEYMICNPITGDLVNRANEIIDSLPLELTKRFSYELLLSEIEVNTPVCMNLNEALDEIIKLRKYVSKLGKKFEFKIGISGTHPTALPESQKFVKNKSYNWVADQLTYYAQRNITFATHIHVSVPDAETAVHVTNGLRQWVAPLLALSSNSPFYSGINTHFKSSRTMQFGAFPRTNIPPYFKCYRDYQNLVSNYIDVGSIEKSRQIWWKLRPHMDYGTIEFRMLDVQRSLKRTELFIALAQALVYQSTEDYKNNRLNEVFHTEYLDDSLWKASRFGFDAYIIDVLTGQKCTIREKIYKMMEYADSALKIFDNEHVIEEFDKIMSTGTEADKQLLVYKNQGMDSLKKYLMDSVDFSIL